jgi:tetratricopeptide (TPR) repeat protein
MSRVDAARFGAMKAVLPSPAASPPQTPFSLPRRPRNRSPGRRNRRHPARRLRQRRRSHRRRRPPGHRHGLHRHPPLPPLNVAPIPAAKPAAEVKPAVTPSTSPVPVGPPPDRATAYYHAALADTYEDMATNYGRQEFVTRAVEEYKLALNADPNSSDLAIGLAELYFRAGRIPEAIQTAKALIKKDDNNIDAHKLLGRIYLRSLGQKQDQNQGATASPARQAGSRQSHRRIHQDRLLEPKSLEDRLLLGQLYTVKHDNAKAEAQFKAAQAIEPASEDVLLNLARLYAESGDIKRAAELLEAVPSTTAPPRKNSPSARPTSSSRIKKDHCRLSARRRHGAGKPRRPAFPGPGASGRQSARRSPQTVPAIPEADPEDAARSTASPRSSAARASTTSARHHSQGLAKEPDSLEAGYNEGLLLDVLGRYDEAIATYQKMVDLTGHANGAYTQEEKANRSIFLERLGSVYHEQNKTPEAIATYQKMIDLGGEFAKAAIRARSTPTATPRCSTGNRRLPQSRRRQSRRSESSCLLAWELADTGKLDEGLPWPTAC